MNSEQLKQLQTPIKEHYKQNPQAALITLKASGDLSGPDISCKIQTGRALVEAGLHPATGGDGSFACSGDMLLEALAACFGVTLKAVATAMDIPLRGGRVEAEGDLDFRGTLGVDKEVSVGFKAIRFKVRLDSDAPAEKIAKLVSVAERYCVVLQTLKSAPIITTQIL